MRTFKGFLMKFFTAVLLAFLFSTVSFSQDALPRLMETEAAFIRSAEGKGVKQAFLEYLAPDSILFRPQAVNGHSYWKDRDEAADRSLVRKTIYGDISSNGMLGYTTGNWRLYPKGQSESSAIYGQYVTIWERRQDGTYRASVDIAITHDKLPFSETDAVGKVDRSRDPNKRGWSPADASMNFLRMSMTNARLGGAYEEYAADDIRLLVDGEPPLLGRKRVVRAMNRYVAADFPTKVTMFQAADMAYTWNPCKFTNNDEGMENGNCLNIWKLRDKKWWIVLAVYAKFPNDKPPVIKRRP